MLIIGVSVATEVSVAMVVIDGHGVVMEDTVATADTVDSAVMVVTDIDDHGATDDGAKVLFNQLRSLFKFIIDITMVALVLIADHPNKLLFIYIVHSRYLFVHLLQPNKKFRTIRFVSLGLFLTVLYLPTRSLCSTKFNK